WYQDKGRQLLKGKAGRKPRFSDSEVMMLMIAEDYIPYPGETQYLGYIRSSSGSPLLAIAGFNARLLWQRG
ncbi:MAG: hypothetical protein AAF787_18045, partial [Chloroflexota bacterium]